MMGKVDHEKGIIDGFLAGEPSAYDTINSWISTVLDRRSWHRSIRIARNDIKQEVLVALTENFRNNKYNWQGLKSYIRVITKNKCLQAYGQSVEIDSDRTNHSRDIPSALEIMVRDEECHIIKKALLQLNRKCQKMIAFRFYNHLDHNEIAKTFNISVEASRQQLKRCMDRLRELTEEIYCH